MAKTLQSLINLAPSAAEPIEGKLHWFTNNKFQNGCTWISGHGDTTNGGGMGNSWTVPSGVSEITFHIWGSGGVGAAAMCCMQGIPAGAGAYAKKKITSGFSAGDIYRMCLGDARRLTCADAGAQTNDVPASGGGWDPTLADQKTLKGCRGNTTYVQGPGLTNFCAEGGNPGISYFGMIRGACPMCCAGPNGGFGNPHNCWSTVQMCDMIDRDPDDSDGSPWRRACYYGADEGSRGVHACFQNGCCGCYEPEPCRHNAFIMWIAHPGGKWWMGHTTSTKYGFTAGNNWYNCIGNAHLSFGPHGTADRQHMMSSTIGNNNFDNGGAMVGVGGLTAWTCGGPCCCGGYGGNGLVVIQYK